MKSIAPAKASSSLDSANEIGAMSSRTEKFKRWGRLFAQFVAGQGAVQVVNLLSGFLLLRWMSELAYAQYSVCILFQTTLNTLVDLGFSGCITALVGDRHEDPEVIGSYIRCARHYRFWLFVILGIASAALFPLIVIKQPWGAPVKTELWAATLASVFFQSYLMYGAPLLIGRKLRAYYVSQLLPALGRIGIAFVLFVSKALTAPLIAGVGAISFLVQGVLYKRAASPLISEPAHPNSEHMLEMRRYLAPTWPGMIYYAFAGQITIALITVFGKTSGIAEVSAIGRLGQFFLLLSMMNYVLIEPYIARLPKHKVAPRYLLVAGGTVGLCLLAIACARLFPGPIVWLLGPKYAQLRDLIWIQILVSCLYHLSGVLYVMNGARKWVYWQTTTVATGATILAQVIMIAKLPMGTTADILRFSVISGIVSVVGVAVTGLYGQARDAR
jgi:hypothetical protein